MRAAEMAAGMEPGLVGRVAAGEGSGETSRDAGVAPLQGYHRYRTYCALRPRTSGPCQLPVPFQSSFVVALPAANPPPPLPPP